MAVILGCISLISLNIVVFKTYQNGGEATVGYGLTGVLATVFSLVGLILGIVTVKDKAYYKLFPILGIVLNLLAFAFVSAILYVGANLS